MFDVGFAIQWCHLCRILRCRWSWKYQRYLEKTRDVQETPGCRCVRLNKTILRGRKLFQCTDPYRSPWLIKSILLNWTIGEILEHSTNFHMLEDVILVSFPWGLSFGWCEDFGVPHPCLFDFADVDIRMRGYTGKGLFNRSNIFLSKTRILFLLFDLLLGNSIERNRYCSFLVFAC